MINRERAPHAPLITPACGDLGGLRINVHAARKRSHWLGVVSSEGAGAGGLRTKLSEITTPNNVINLLQYRSIDEHHGHEIRKGRACTVGEQDAIQIGYMTRTTIMITRNIDWFIQSRHYQQQIHICELVTIPWSL
jgi:hypothetical protein